MSLREMARLKGKNLTQLGIKPTHASQINVGIRRAGPSALARMSEALGLPIPEIAAVCDAVWMNRRISTHKHIPSPLRELAKSKGKTLNDLGVASARIIASGHRRAGPDAIARMALALGVPGSDVQTACDAAWLAKNGTEPHTTDATAPGAA